MSDEGLEFDLPAGQDFEVEEVDEDAYDDSEVIEQGKTGEDSRTVFVGNLAYSTSWQDLKDFMRQGLSLLKSLL